MSDGSGDRLVGRLDEPANPVAGSPLILIIHGLTGCEDSSYMRETARFNVVRGRPVLRLNLRGAGPGRHVAGGYYHGGCASDIEDVLNGLPSAHAPNGVFLIGFSLGGNVLLNFLADLSPGHRVVGAATVSAPIEPLEACRRLMQPRNALYHRFLLYSMKRDVLSSTELSQDERRDIEAANSIYEFDDRWVAPRNSFRDAPDYYERTAGARCVASVTVPTLMLHARNDPWIPAEPYARVLTSSPDVVEVVLAGSGGHVGFHEHGHTETWHDRMIDAFLSRTPFG